MNRFLLNLIIILFLYLPYNFYNILFISIRPDMLMITIYYFSIIRKINLSIIFLIIIGLLNDNLYDNNLGIQSIIYICIYIFGNTNINSLWKQKFNVVLISFTILIISSISIKYIINIIQISKLFHLTNEILNGLMTILVYSFFHLLYSKYLTWFINHNER